MGLFSSSGGEKRGRGRPRKDPFADLPEDFKANTEHMSVDELRQTMGDISKVSEETKQARKDDIDLADKKEAVKEAGAVYKEILDANSLKTRWLMRLLSNKGAD